MLNKYGLGLAIFAVLLFLSPYIFLGQNAFIMIEDNLDDCEFISRLIVARSGLSFNYDASLPQIMNGLPRACVSGGLKVIMWFFQWFPPYSAYVINEIIIHLIAFLGMYGLLQTHVFRRNENQRIALGCSLGFALLPFFPMMGLSVAGQPLLLFAYLNLLKKQSRWTDFLIITAFPFYSSLFYAGIFIIIALAAFLLIDSYKNRQINLHLLGGTLLLVLTYMITDWGFIDLIFLKHFVSHRVEFDLAASSSGGRATLREVFSNFVSGHYQVASFHGLILLIAFFALIKGMHEYKRWILGGLGLILLIAIVQGLYSWNGITWFTQRYVLLKSFQWNRFYFFYPLLWYLIFALSLAALMKLNKKIINCLILIQIVILLVNNPEYIGNGKNAGKFLLNQFFHKQYKFVSYRSFFAESTFDQIKQYIHRPLNEYRVVSIGIHPAVAQYNGLYTLDSYQVLYPLSYKHQFRKIIEKELAKKGGFSGYFDHWGSRCYIFPAERGWEIKHLELNIPALKKMGGKYILSARKIVNYQENHLKTLKIFEGEAWRIYLYQVL